MSKIILVFSMLLSLLYTDTSKAQEKIISGSVITRVNKMPLKGVRVAILKKNEIAYTDNNGVYTVKAAIGDQIEFSYLGLRTTYVTIGLETVINVVMDNELEKLDEVMVVAYGIKTKARKLAYSIQTIRDEDIINPETVNVTNVLSGRAAGVQINQNSTGVNGSSNIIIRGTSSLSLNNQPLIVIDGLIVDNGGLGQGDFTGGIDYGNALSDINPEDIASIHILKGGNATALYGYRGANGVVVITSKNGTSGKTQIDFSSSITLDDILIAPKFQNEYGQGQFDTQSGQLLYDIGTSNSWGPRMDESQRIRFDGVGTAPYSANDNSFKDYYRTGHTSINAVAIAQDLERINYRFSYSYLDNKSILPGSQFDRHNISLKVQSSVSEKLKVTTKIDYIQSNGLNRPDLTDGQANSVKNLALRPRNISNNLLSSNFIKQDGTPNNWSGAFVQNPYYAAYTRLNADRKDRYLGLVKIDYSLSEKLLVSLRVGHDHSNTNALIFQPLGAFDVRPNGGMVDIISTNSIKNYDALLTYNSIQIVPDLNLDVTLGASQSKDVYKLVRATGENIMVPGLFAIDNFSKKNIRTRIAETKSNSLFSSVTLGFRNYAFLEITGRNDWSSTLPIHNASFFYPSIGVSFVVTEALNKKNTFLNYLKLRGSYANVGNATEPYRLRNTYNVSSNTYNGQSFFFFGSNGANSEEGAAPGINLSNPDLKAELSRTYEIGMDAIFFNNRMSLDISYYNNETENQILSLSLPPSYGAESRIINAGLVKNSGIEISLRGKLINAKKFAWHTMVNFSKNKSKIVELAKNIETQVLVRQFNDVVQLVASQGRPYGDLVGSTYQRDDQGRLLYDSDGLPIIGALGAIGNVTPDFLLSWQNSFRYKNLMLKVLMDSRFGGDIFSFSDIALAKSGTDERTLSGREFFSGGQGIMVPQDAVINGELSEETKQNGVNPETYWNRVGSISEAWVYDASFIKLREISLTYEIKNNWVKSLGVNSLVFGYVGRNLALLYKQTPNFDPENGFNTGFSGIEFFGFPSTRSHGFKIKFSI